MRRVVVVLLALFSASAAAGWGTQGGGLTCPPGYIGGGLVPCAPAQSFAFFEFAPAPNAFGVQAGMGAPCACAAVTGAKGEAMAFTRISSATCAKGNLTTGIANGDLVTCGISAPRVGNPDGTGLKLLIETSRTNAVLRSQELDNAAWAKAGTFAPTVTADFAAAPDGTTTAERVQFSATSAAQTSYVSQIGPVSALGSVFSVYVRGNGTSGAVDVCTETTAANYCVTCLYASASWARCVTLPSSIANPNVYVGNLSLALFNGATARAASDVLVWGAQIEAGGYASSYVPTTSAPVARGGDSASFTGSWANAPLSMAATVVFAGARSGYSTAAALYASATSYVLLGSQSVAGTTGIESFATTGTTSSVASALASGDRVFGYVTAASTAGALNGGKNGSTGVAATSPSAVTFTALNLGAWAGAGSLPLDGYVGAVCLDPSPTRCH